MEHLALADWFIILAYLVGIILFGVRFGRGQKTTRDYFLGSSNVSWWGVGLSIVATETSALTFIGIPAIAYGGDLAFIQIVIGYVVARILLAILFVPHYFKGEIYSPYQLLGDAFGRPARLTAGGFFLIAGTLAAGVRVYVTCIPLQLIFGLENDEIIWVILLFVGLSLIYTFVGGMKAVIWTDAVQFFLFMLGGLFTLWYVPTLIDGGFMDAMRQAGEAGKLKWLNLNFSLAQPFNLWMGLVGAVFLAMASHGADQLIVQRVLACGSVAAGRKSLVLSAVIILPLFLIFLLVGILLWVYYQAHPEMPIPIPEVRPGIGKNDYVFPIFILTMMPPILKGLLIVAILSAAMSSVSSALAALASVSTMDFVKGMIRRGRDEHFYFQLSRYSTLFWAALLILVAFLTQQVVSVLNVAFTLSGLTNGAMLGGLILALWWKGRNWMPVVAGMVASLGIMILINRVWTDEVYWPWYTLIGTAVTLGVATLVRACGGKSTEPPAPARAD
ncbi:MAG TPA: sodium/solute symporter [Methylomirabilota bacterium]|nr:sodium/solute symporter [Methylomirabilota bacterium]